MTQGTSSSAFLAAVADRLPPRTKQTSVFSEFTFSNANELRQKLQHESFVIADYDNFWLTRTSRYNDHIWTFTFLFLGALAACFFIFGLLGLFKDSHDAGTIATLTISAVSALYFTAKYAVASPPHHRETLTLLDGKRKELIYIKLVHEDEVVDQVVRVPFDDLIVEIKRFEASDKDPSGSTVYLAEAEQERDNRLWPPGLLLKLVSDLSLYAPVPEEVRADAEAFASALGVALVDRSNADA